MKPNNIVENIVYLNYTSTSIESPYHDDSSRPDSLPNIMRDNIIILPTDIPEDRQDNKPKE